MSAFRDAAAGLYGAAWDARREAYALGLRAPAPALAARVASIGNLTLGGTGKTTLTLHLARRAVARGLDVAVVCRRYRPGPSALGDEERLYRRAIGEARVYGGRRKRDLAAAAVAAGHRLVLVDDGFSHWALRRDVDVVLLDAGDPWGGRALVPAGRLREPLRALQRAHAVVITRVEDATDVAGLLEDARRHAPAARLGAARHRVEGWRDLAGASVARPDRARVVTATGNPAAVDRTVAAAGCEVVDHAHYRDHHAFTPGEAARERAHAETARATLVLTAKDAVRWPDVGGDVRVVEVGWEWTVGGEAIERLVLEGEARE